MSKRFALTTQDNPFDPFMEFEQWYRFDEDKGYHTTSKLARVVVYSDELSEADKSRHIELAIDQLIEINPYKNYKKLVEI